MFSALVRNILFLGECRLVVENGENIEEGISH